MRAAIYGAGSLGTVLGAYITEAGGQIDLINRNKKHVEALRKNGAKIIGTVQKNVKVKVLFPDEMEGKYDVIFLMTKQLFNEEVVTMLKKFLAKDGIICTLQNGIPEPLIASIVGQEHTMGCTVEWGATLLEPGVVELTSDTDSLSFHMGKMEGVSDEQFKMVKDILELMCPVEFEENLIGARWSKLLINATFSGLGTVVGGTFGSISESKVAKPIAVANMKECIDVGHAAGVTFAPVQGKDITKLFYYKGGLKKAFAKLLLPIAMKKHRDIVPSMHQDICNGKKCEIEAINGVVCEYGKKYKVPTPYNDKIVEIVKQINEGKLEAQMSNLELFD